MKNLKELLQGMIEAAESKNRTKVLELNSIFDDLVLTSVKGYNEYDNLRQSCILSLNIPTLYDECIEDAKKRFKKLYE
jgi:hypothetical protein